jgi:hypothetical protein
MCAALCCRPAAGDGGRSRHAVTHHAGPAAARRHDTASGSHATAQGEGQRGAESEIFMMHMGSLTSGFDLPLGDQHVQWWEIDQVHLQ